MHDSDIFSVASRRRIFDCVQEHPGAHLREIARLAGLPLGTTLYHLDFLHARNVVTARRDGRYKRYFASHGLGRREKEVMSLLRHDAPRRIAHSLLVAGPGTQRELCGRLGLSRSTLSFHVNRLVDEDVVARIASRPENRYALKEGDVVRELLGKYADSLGHDEPDDDARRLVAPRHGPVAAEVL